MRLLLLKLKITICLTRSSFVWQLVGSSLTHVLAGDSPSMINDYGFQRLLGDVTALERFSDKSGMQGLGSDLAQCREICYLFVDGKVGNN